MAQRKKRRAALRGKTAPPRKLRGRAAAAKGRATKRSSAKARLQKRSAKAKTKTKRIVAKAIAPKKAVQRKQPKELPIEVVRVEQLAEPAPGVVVVSEYESVQAGSIQVTAVPDEPK